MNLCRMCLSCLTFFILISILLLCWSSPLSGVKIHRKLLPQWDFFTHLSLIRDLNVHWRRTPQGNWLHFTTYKQILSQIKLLTCTSLSSAGSDGAQADRVTLKLLHRRPAIMVLMNGWTSGYWSPFRVWCIECLGVGGGCEAAKLFCIYKLRSECSWGLGKVLGDLGHQSDRVKSTVKLLSKSYIVMRSKSLLSPPQTRRVMGEMVNTVHSVLIAVYLIILCFFVS